jgi:hypothetical protein
MGNISELLINVVRRDKSKVLRDLNQKVRVHPSLWAVDGEEIEEEGDIT